MDYIPREREFNSVNSPMAAGRDARLLCSRISPESFFSPPIDDGSLTRLFPSRLRPTNSDNLPISSGRLSSELQRGSRATPENRITPKIEILQAAQIP